MFDFIMRRQEARAWLLRERADWLRLAGCSALVAPSPTQVASNLGRFDWALHQPPWLTVRAARELGWKPREDS